ncbi:hypothetical protein FLP41_18850 [Paracoccus marcusii]|uniref:hypothetical protein n=1 Tax=Paracoccus marcusii TaxID=59779 RepID=UPI002ED4294B|nr:hypothetical protein FLP41_18850 [Paracoccus marcusii]
MATLGMMLIVRGVALQLTGATPISQLGAGFGRLAAARCSAWSRCSRTAFRA